MRQKTIGIKNNSMIKAILVGGMLAWLVTMILGWILSALITTETVKFDYVSHCVILLMLTASVISSLISRSIVDKKKIIAGFGASIVLALMLNLTAAAVFRKLSASYILTYVVIILGSAVPAVLSFGNNRGGNKRRIRMKSV